MPQRDSYDASGDGDDGDDGAAAEPGARATAPRRGALARGIVALGVAGVWAIGFLPWLLGARCPVAVIAGTPCPGCGMTRAAMLVLHGHVAEGIRLHPLALPCAAATMFLALSSVVVTFRYGTPRALVDKPGLGPFALGVYVAMVAAVALLWLARSVGLAGGPVPI